MAWHLKAQMTEACSCNMFCPCWFAVSEYMVMDQGWCAGSMLFEIETGESDGVDLSGRTVTILAHWPGPTLFDGKGTGRVFVDEGASDQQAREIERIFQGQRGSTFEILAGLISTWLPIAKTAIRVTRDGDLVTATVGNVGEISSKAIRDDQGHGFTIQGGGFIGAFGMEQAELAPTNGTKWFDPAMPRTFETKSGARGAVSLRG